jgi:hypothetical protein
MSTRLAVVGVVVAVAFGGAGCGDLSRGELRRGVGTLKSVAAEGELLALQVARDRSKATFARVQAATLAGQAEHEAEKLADAEPAPGLGQEKARAVELASGLSDTLGELEDRPGDERPAVRTARALRTEHRAILDLYGRLL